MCLLILICESTNQSLIWSNICVVNTLYLISNQSIINVIYNINCNKFNVQDSTFKTFYSRLYFVLIILISFRCVIGSHLHRHPPYFGFSIFVRGRSIGKPGHGRGHQGGKDVPSLVHVEELQPEDRRKSGRGCVCWRNGLNLPRTRK